MAWVRRHGERTCASPRGGSVRSGKTYPRVVSAFLDSVEELEGTSCREKLAEEGLSRLHDHFPVEKVELLQDRVFRRLQDELYYWTYRVGLEDLELRCRGPPLSQATVSRPIGTPYQYSKHFLQHVAVACCAS